MIQPRNATWLDGAGTSMPGWPSRKANEVSRSSATAWTAAVSTARTVPEALAGVTDFVTACPKDLTMYTAAAKATGHEDRLAVADLIELVAAAIDLPLEVPALEVLAEGESVPPEAVLAEAASAEVLPG